MGSLDNTVSLYNDNHINFYCGVSNESVSKLTKLAKEVEKSQNEEWERVTESNGHLHLHICSLGGDLASGLAAYQILLNLDVAVTTYVEGNAASAATIISLAGSHRIIGKHSHMLIHEFYGWFQGKYNRIEDEKKNWDDIYEIIVNLYLDETNIPEDDLHDLLSRDRILTADKCLEYGLVDDIL